MRCKRTYIETRQLVCFLPLSWCPSTERSTRFGVRATLPYVLDTHGPSGESPQPAIIIDSSWFVSLLPSLCALGISCATGPRRVDPANRPSS